MKKISNVIQLLLLTLLFSPAISFAQEGGESPDKSQSPYFLVKSDQPGVDALPLKSTSADVNIAGVIADVTVTQVYENTGKHPLEAIYVFPASSRAAVYGMQMTIGNRTITAEIRERNKARAEYEAAKSEGKSASLLEQQRPNVFQMNVANIMPGDVIKVEMKYTELLEPVAGTYEFVYPAVVGPRYTEGSDDDHDSFTSTPYTPKGTASSYDFDLNLYLSAGIPIQHVSSKSHKVDINYAGAKEAEIGLAAGQEKSGNKDFILEYRLAGGAIESGLLLYEHGDENFFVAMIQPPKRVEPTMIPPREYIFIVDVSGSMNGFPLTVSKKLLRDLISSLRPSDRFNVMLFAGATAVMAEESMFATEANIETALNVLQNQRGGGGTRLYPALEQALAMPVPNNMARSFLVVTDGYISVEKDCFDLIRDNLDQASLFPFGIGSGVNRHLMEGMAHVGMSESFIVTNENDGHAAAEKFREYIKNPVWTHLKPQISGLDVYDMEPATLPDVLADRPVLIYGKYRGEAKGNITIEGYSGKDKYSQTLNVSKFRPSKKNSAIRYLWARKRIQMLDDYKSVDYGSNDEEEVTALGLKYNLMTAYTSFIAVDNVVRRDENGKLVKVKQSLPLPEGVENTAVGFDLAVEEVRMAPATGLKMEKVARKHIDAGKISDLSELSLQSQLDTWAEARVKSLEGTQLLINGKRQEISLEIKLSANGTVAEVKITGKGVTDALRKSIEAIVNRWKFSGTLAAPVSFILPVTLQK